MNIVAIQDIAQRIFTIRGVKVMLDQDLAELYGVETKRLKEQVRRNRDRFPDDFMFELTYLEVASLRSQFATLKSGRGQHSKYVPFAFTEQGVAMLSGILHSKEAVQVNIQIMRAFVKMRHMILNNEELKREIEALKEQTAERFEIVFTVLDQLVSEDSGSKRKIGFIKNCLTSGDESQY